MDSPWWDDMVTGVPRPIIQDGYIDVPEAPGLGIELNDDVVREHLHESETEYFAPTHEWDDERSHDRLWS